MIIRLKYKQNLYQLTGYQRAERKTLLKIQSINDLCYTQKPAATANHQSADNRTENRKHHNRANVLEEVSFVQIVARLEDDGRQQHQEESCRWENFFALKDRLHVGELQEHADQCAKTNRHNWLGQRQELRLKHKMDEENAKCDDTKHEENRQWTSFLWYECC